MKTTFDFDDQPEITVEFLRIGFRRERMRIAQAMRASLSLNRRHR